MHSRIRLFIPLGLLFFGCIDVPPVEQPPIENPPSDAGTQGDFSLTVVPTRTSLFQGKSQTLQLTLTRQGDFSGSVSVSAVNAPAGISVLPTTISAGSTSVNLDVSVAESATPGTQVLTLRATAGALSHDTAFELTVVKLGDLLVSWASPSLDKLYVNGQLPLEVTVEGGTADYVEVLKGQTVLKRLTASPYQFTWDTTQEADGDYVITARAVRSSGTFTGTTKSVTVDHTAPTLVSRSPAVDASNVSVREVLQANFSEALNPSTVKDSSVLVTVGGANIAKTLSLSADGKSLTVTPSSPLPVQSTVAITLGTATTPLMDLAGNALAATPWAFSVPAWLPMGGGLSALPGNTPAENVAMKVGADGNPVIAWSEFDGTANKIYVRRWTGSAWQTMGNSLKALTGANVNANRPSLVLDASNQPIVMWDEGTDNYHSSLYGAKWNGTSWISLPGMPPPPQINGYEGLTTPSMVLDGKGRLAVAATAYTTDVGTGVVGYQLTAAQDGWTSAAPGPSDAGQAASIKLAVTPSGDIIASYSAVVEVQGVAYRGMIVQKLESWGAWSRFGGPMRFSNSGSARDCSVTTDGAGNPLVAWTELESADSDLRVYAAWWMDGAWKQLGDMIGTQSSSNSKPFVLVGNDGKPLIAWSGYASPARNVWVSRWDGSSWQLVGAPLSAVGGSTSAAYSPVMALDKNGYPLVAWHESDGTASNVSDIYVYRYNY